MPKRTGDYHAGLLEELRDPRMAVQYLNAALEDSEEMFLKALRNVAEANQMAKVAEEAGVQRESLYRMLSETGNPTYHSFSGILRALKLRFQFVATPLVEQPIPVGQTTDSEVLNAILSEEGFPERTDVEAQFSTMVLPLVLSSNSLVFSPDWFKSSNVFQLISAWRQIPTTREDVFTPPPQEPAPLNIADWINPTAEEPMDYRSYLPM
ncbi:MAG: putative addiction module antidote protein [Acidobacteriia bacterium]|nr:putative addiction module antidote protein [Terriglobia bacterium]